MTDHGDTASTDRGRRRRYTGYLLGSITYAAGRMVMPITQKVGNTGREPGHFGGGQGKGGREP